MEMDPFILSGNEVSGPNKLAEFSKAKEEGCKIFQEFKDCLHKVKTDFTGFQQRMKRPTDDDFLPRKKLSKIYDAEKKVNEILEILQRNYMKIVYFGRTSNGKSTVINAMLHDHILPTGLGQTTTSFIEVKGSKEEKATVACGSTETQIVECQETLRKAVKDLNKERHALIEVSWPGSKCQLLREHIRLVDCPGYNDSFAMDQKLEEVCQGADVFVLVINAVSSISEHDTKYFKEVSRHVSKPNIFVLFNFWDMSSDADPEDRKEARQQHTDRATTLLAKELQVVEEWEVKERIFFVSAKEVLGKHMNKTIEKEEKKDTEDRLKEFEAFECTVKELDAFVEETLNESLRNSEIETYILLFNQGIKTKILDIKKLYQILREEHVDQDLHFEGNVQVQSIPKLATAIDDHVKIKLSLTLTNEHDLISSIYTSVGGKLLSFGISGSGTSLCVTGILIGSSAAAFTGVIGIALGLMGMTYSVLKDVRNWMNDDEKVFQQKYADYVKQHKQEFINSINSHMLQHIKRKLSNGLEQLKAEAKYHLRLLVSQRRMMLAQESRQLTKWRSDFETLDVKLSNFKKEYLK